MRNPGRIKPLNPREPCTAKPQQQRPEPKRTSPHNLDKPKPKPTRTKPNLFINNLTSLPHLQLPHLPHSPSTTPTTSSNPREALLHPLLPLLWLPSFDPESTQSFGLQQTNSPKPRTRRARTSFSSTMEHQQNQQQQQPQQPPPPQGGVPGPTGRRLHIAHRRSPSELTPLMSMFSSPGSKFHPHLQELRHRSSSAPICQCIYHQTTNMYP